MARDRLPRSPLTRAERWVALSLVLFGVVLAALFESHGHPWAGRVALAYYLWAVSGATFFAHAHQNADDGERQQRMIAGMIFSLPIGLGFAGFAYFYAEQSLGKALLSLAFGIVGNMALHWAWNMLVMRSRRDDVDDERSMHAGTAHVGLDESDPVAERLHVSYHSWSNSGLDSETEDQLKALLNASVPFAALFPFMPPHPAGSPADSVVGERKAILLIEGVIATTDQMQKLLTQLYLVFDRRLLICVRDARIEHFALIFDLQCDNRIHYVAIDFKDRITLAINFYRLDQHIDAGKCARADGKLTELEYPKGASVFGYLPAFGTSVPTTLAAVGIWLTLDEIVGSWQAVLRVVVAVLYGAAMLWIWGGFVILPRQRHRDYLRRYEMAATAWAATLRDPAIDASPRET